MQQLHDVSETSTAIGLNYRHIRATVKNSGTSQCNQKVYLSLDGSNKSVEGINIGPGETVPVDFYFKAIAAPTGTYTLMLKMEDGTPFYNSSFTVTDNSSLPKLDLVTSEVKNLIDGIVYGMDIEADIVLRNSTKTAYDYNMDLDVAIEESSQSGGSSYPAYHMKQHVAVAPGETVTVPLRFVLAEGDRFKITVKDQNLIYLNTKYMVVSPAVVLWDGSGKHTTVVPSNTITVPASAAAVSLMGISDISKVTIKPNNNPNTLYYLRSDATTPTALSKKNVVKGTKSSSITLVGGYDFYVPKSFTADKITYSFTPTLAYDGKGGWQTIMLPFTVTSVTSGGKAVDWCRKSDNDKQFLLKEFIGDTNTSVAFANVNSWSPCTPYILGVPTSLINKKMVFTAADAWVATTEKPVSEGANFRFVASTEEKTVTNALLLNASGSGFVMTASGLVKAGGAYFEPLNTKAAATKTLSISGSTISPPGDANGDDTVTVADALCVVDAILSGNVRESSLDINEDGRVNVTDVMCIIKILVGKQESDTAR